MNRALKRFSYEALFLLPSLSLPLLFLSSSSINPCLGGFCVLVKLTDQPATMARHGDTRSPSPVGSTLSSSRRPRREDDRYDRTRRDDGRSYRRSRSPEVSAAHRIFVSYLAISDHPCDI